MRSRMERYHHEEIEENNRTSRSSKNEELYRDIGKNTKYTNFTDISHVNAVNFEEASKSSRTRQGYHQMKDYSDIFEQPKVKKELDEFNYLYQDHENRVYDINSVLKDARENRENKDELEKKRKLKNTNYNILASLNPEELEKYRLEKQKNNKPDPEELKELIDTITSKTLRGEIDKATTVNLLSDLMASSPTDEVRAEDIELSKQIVDQDPIEKAKNKGEKKDLDNSSTNELDGMDRSFYTRSMDLSDKDFNFSEGEESKKIPVFFKVLLALLLLIVLGVAIYFLIQSI